jgi:Ni/Co efflux regulator RcnB
MLEEMVMRKIIMMALMAAVAVPTVAPAQSREEVRRDRQDVREERRELRDAQRFGTREDVREERRELRSAQRELREDRRDFRRNEWREYRNTNRGIYRRGTWRAPFRYQTFRPGVRIGVNYFSPRYIINDPWRYRLPRAIGNQRWVRHYDDLLLVDVRRGRVLDVIRNFYW